jgi:D-sedoheptulose 7-phosphate isomerase
MEHEAKIVELIEETIKLNRYLQKNVNKLEAIANLLITAFKEGNKVLLFGNGGSAAIAEHIACELALNVFLDDVPVPAIALTTNTATLTAIGNDYGFEKIFAHQVKSLVTKGDVVIGISVGGNSPNVLHGIQEAKILGASTVALTGKEGLLKESADYVLSVPSINTQRIEEGLTTAGHIIYWLVKQALTLESEGQSSTKF